MARGPKKHMKRLNAPKHWMLDKLGGQWAPRPSTGPHKLRECLPLSLILRNRLKYSLSRRETILVVMRRNVKVDHKIRTDINYPAGFQDIVQIDASNENFRLLYDVKGRFTMHRVQPEEAQYKLVRVKSVAKSKKATSGRNPYQTGQRAAIPIATTHDGRTIRFADPDWKVNDTLKFNIATGKVEGHLKFEVGRLAMITGGNNIGRVGTIAKTEKHPGSFDIIHLVDERKNTFATRLSNVFVIGTSAGNPWVSLPRGNGVRYGILEKEPKV